jgi:CheY-like chemotaxis protein
MWNVGGIPLPILFAGNSRRQIPLDDDNAGPHPACNEVTRVAQSVSSHGGPNPMRILVVDDHADTVRAMQLFLERHGYVVHTARSIREALEIASDQVVDVLVSDIGLPDGSGIDLLHAMNRIRRVQAIAFSGFGMPDDIKRSMDAGFREHIVKPTGLPKLCQVLERLKKFH